MQNKYRMKSVLIKAFIGVLCSGVLCSGEIERIARPMGWRALSPTEQIALKKERASQAAAHADQMNSRSKSFSTTHDGAYHTPFVISHNGENIELEDGSIWVVSPDDRSKTKTWISADLLIIMPNTSWFSSEDYKLVNLSTGEAGKVNLIVPPAFNGLYTYWITAIDTVERKIRLNDGSSWKMTRWDESVVKGWLLNDTVIIGVNDGWFTGQPNILINVDTSNYARGRVLINTNK